MPEDRFPLAGHRVRRVGFGAMQLPGPGVFGPPKDRDQALAVLRRVIDAGVDHIDTSQFYGPDVANELIHEALSPYPAGLVLVSKVGASRDDRGGWHPAQRPAELRSGVQANLAGLGIDRVPIVNLRRIPGGEVGFDEQLDAMVAMRDEGLIGAVGVSNVTLDEYRQATTRTEIACVQNAYSVADRSAQQLLEACRDDEVAFVPFFPLGSAFNANNPVLTSEVVRGLADGLGVSPAQVALAWLLATAPNVLLIPGTSSPDHLEQNLAVGSIELDAAAMADLESVAA
ncbi:MAG: oxidoreductase [Acidimicrobiales bacterium]